MAEEGIANNPWGVHVTRNMKTSKELINPSLSRERIERERAERAETRPALQRRATPSWPSEAARR